MDDRPFRAVMVREKKGSHGDVEEDARTEVVGDIRKTIITQSGYCNSTVGGRNRSGGPK